MVALSSRGWSGVLALALLVSLSVVSADGRAAPSAYDNVDRVDVTSYTAAGIAVSQRVYPDGADAAVLTRDDHFPDALAASALAAKVNGPVLFTNTDGLTAATATELDRILDAGDTVYLTGGTAALSQQVADQVRARGYEVVRLEGGSRIETAVAIAEFVGAPASGHVLLARAYGRDGADRVTGWVDSVTCGGYANHARTPVLLTQTAELDAATATALDALGATTVTICGGTSAVSDTVAQQLRDRSLSVARTSGATRIETAIDVAEKLFGHGSAAGRTYVLVPGYGENFGWGLAATPLAGDLGAPILLVDRDQPTSCTDTSQSTRATLCHLETVGDGWADLIVIGGAAQVSDTVRDAAAEAAGGSTSASDAGDGDGALATPTGVSTSNVSTSSEGRVTVRWDAVSDPDSRLKGYNVYYGQDRADTQAGGGATTVGADATSFTVGALQLDTTYRFAVTSVTDADRESDASAPRTITTHAPAVDLTSPSSAAAVRTEPDTDVTVAFDYTASEGGTFQLFRRVEGTDTWTAFSETPNSTPPTVVAGHDRTRTFTVTAPSPSQATTYDLMVALTPAGSAQVHDVEIGALEINEPEVVLREPAATVEKLPDATVDVVFDYDTNADGTYAVSLRYRDPGADPSDWTWAEPAAQGEAPAGPHTGVSETITVPAQEGFYDIRVQIDTGGPTPESARAEARLYVVDPQITLDAPTSGAAMLVPEGPDGSADVTFTTNARGDYAVQYRPDGAAGGTEWTDAPGGSNSTGTGGVQDLTRTVEAPTATGTYDVRVELVPDADPANPVATGDGTGAGDAALHVARLDSVTGPGSSVEPGDPFDASFALATPVAVDYQLAYRRSGTQDAWTTFPSGRGSADAGTSGVVPVTDLTAPAQPDTYDLRVVATPQDGAIGGQVAVVGASALEVVEPSGITAMSPTTADPAQLIGGETFTLSFTSEVAGSYEIEQRVFPDGLWEGVNASPDGRVEAGVQEDVEVTAPTADPTTHANNTYDLRVTLTPDGGSADEVRTEESSLRVASVDITSHADGGLDEETGSTVTAVFDNNVAGDAVVSYAPSDTTDWTDGTSTTVGYGTGNQGAVDVSSAAPGDYDLKVTLTLEGRAETVEDVVSDAFTISDAPAASVAMTDPTEEQPASVSSGDPVPITFTANWQGAQHTYVLEYRHPDLGWQQFPDASATGDAPNGSEQTADVTAPVEAGTYDLQVRLLDDAGAQVDFDVQVGALVVGAPGTETDPLHVALRAPECMNAANPNEEFFLTVANLTTSQVSGVRGAFVIDRTTADVETDLTSLEYRLNDGSGGAYQSVTMTWDAAAGNWRGRLAELDGFSVGAAPQTVEFQLRVTVGTGNTTAPFTFEVQAEDGAGDPLSNTDVRLVTATALDC